MLAILPRREAISTDGRAPMFTTMPGLAQSIERLIDETPIIDPHTHIHCDRPSATDLTALFGYHWVQTELIAVGMPKSDLDTGLPVDERIRRMIPYLARMRNTAMSWCVYRILWDLYEFAEPAVTESNYRDLIDRVAARGSDPAWPAHVLRDRCNIRTFVTSLGNRGEATSAVAPDALFMLDAHYLFCPGVATDLEPFFNGRHTKQEYVEALFQVLGDRPGTTDRLKQLLFDWLDRTVTGPVRFTNTFIPIERRFHQPEEPQVQLALSQAAGDQAISEHQIDALVNFVSWSLLEWHHDHRKAVQIAVGAEYFICDGKSIPRFQPDWTSEMARAFHHFGGARFDLMMASDVLSQEVAVLARQFPNVYTSGYWWHTFFPSLIERHFSLRSQVVPMTKFCAYLSDSYSVEWAYGKLQVIKRAVASALAGQVEAGFAREEDLPELLSQILHDSPRDLYDLHR
jgi:glucuronate isomerase